MIEGQWIEEDTFLTKKGKFQREDTQIRDQIGGGEAPNLETPSGKAADEETVKYPPEARRYHLYVSYACPWAPSWVRIDLDLGKVEVNVPLQIKV